MMLLRSPLPALIATLTFFMICPNLAGAADSSWEQGGRLWFGDTYLGEVGPPKRSL